MSPARAVDYTTVSEVPGNRIRREALAQLEIRYGYAVELCRGRDVLEVGCGAGMGLGRLASAARSVIGGDYSAALLARARRHYGDRVPLVRLDAGRLPFRDATLDVVVLFEALYYLPSAEDFLREARRLLRPGGALVICSTNVEWPDFNPSPFSVRYLTALELRHTLEHHGFDVQMFTAFRSPQSLRARVVSLIRRAAVACHLVPRTMSGKEWLKRLFYGTLLTVPAELGPPTTPGEPLVPLPPGASARDYEMIYAVGRR
jgi:SAM-dependent methyltransferase